MVIKMKIWAVIEKGVVANTILWDGENEWTPGEHQVVVEIPGVPDGEQHVGIGWEYSDGVFIPPPEQEEETPAS